MGWEACRGCYGSGDSLIKPFPKTFTVGYLGAVGADKGLRYLMEAWRKLNYKDALLVIAGRDSTSPFVTDFLWPRFGGGNVHFMGWVKDVADFYNQVSVVVQPSVSEGFGIEVLEAMAHGRPVICSNGAGAVDVVGPRDNVVFTAGDVDGLVGLIDQMKTVAHLEEYGRQNRERAKELTWAKIRERYKVLWRELLP